MRRRAVAILLALALPVAPSTQAQAPERSLLPVPRGVPDAAGPAAVSPAPADPAADVAAPAADLAAGGATGSATSSAPRASLRPLLRGQDAGQPAIPAPPGPEDDIGPSVAAALARAADVPTAATTQPDALRDVPAPDTSPRPAGRPPGLEERTRAIAARQTPGRVTQPGQRGQLCGSPGLSGERLERITGRSAGCGIAEPVRLRMVDGIALTTPATITCDAARALQTWVRAGLMPTVGSTGGGVANLRVVASYACRTRNSQSGARLSEHARGNAIDIAGIGLNDGSELTVLSDWGSGRDGRMLRQLHQAACGPFGTVLGPNSDRFHRDHFHFDVASYRSGSYCR